MNKKNWRTCGEDVIPPIRLADVSFQIVGRFGNDDVRRSDNSADRQKYGKNGYNDAQSFDQVQIGDFYGFGRADSKDDWNSV